VSLHGHFHSHARVLQPGDRRRASRLVLYKSFLIFRLPLNIVFLGDAVITLQLLDVQMRRLEIDTHILGKEIYFPLTYILVAAQVLSKEPTFVLITV